jgi:probable Rubsico expression protein CbbX
VTAPAGRGAPPAPPRQGFGAAAQPVADSPAAPDQDEAVDTLPRDGVVDLAGEREAAGVDDVLRELDSELVGLVPVKQRVAEIAALLLVDRARRQFGLASQRPNLHMSFTGSPGTGKTTVAVRMAAMLHRLGYLRRGHLVAVTRDDLVGQYVGHTAPKTKEVVKRAMGGVLFIDEAYYLYRRENERDYGQESIEILLQVMENDRDDLVVVLAGYADRMDVFFQSNPGMSSRVGHHLDFPDYDVEELIGIAGLLLDKDRYQLAEDAGPVLREYITLRAQQPRFANARSIRNGLERARLRQARRLVDAGAPVTRDDLVTLTAQDFLGSRVFSSPPAAQPEPGAPHDEAG